MTISENQIDNLTHTISNQLKANGIALDSDQLCDLNDLLSDFIIDKCDVEITDEAHSEPVIQIAFDILEATVDQQVKVINSSYDEEKILDGLKNGTLETQTSVEQGGIQTIDVVGTGEAIAEIISQEINGEYDDYR